MLHVENILIKRKSAYTFKNGVVVASEGGGLAGQLNVQNDWDDRANDTAQFC